MKKPYLDPLEPRAYTVTSQIKNARLTEISVTKPKNTDNDGLCENVLCRQEWPSEYIGWQCDCGGYIWAKGDNTGGPNEQ